MQIICTKVRDGSKRIVRLKEGQPRDRHVVIVDDLVQSGGTLLECHTLLSSLGAKHGVLYDTIFFKNLSVFDHHHSGNSKIED